MDRFRFLITFLFIIFCGLTFPAVAQKPKQIISKAEAAFKQDDLQQAVSLYLQVLPQVPDNFKVNRNLGLIYNQLAQPAIAIPYLEKAVKLSPKFDQELTYALGKAHQLNLNFDRAIELFQFLISLTPEKEEDLLHLYNKHITECLSGKMLMAKKPSAEIVNMGQAFNSPASDHVPLLYGNDQNLLFSSNRTVSPGSKNRVETVYRSRMKEEKWSAADKLPISATFQPNDAITGISQDGKEIYLYRDKNGGDLYFLKNTGNDQWSAPAAFPEPINSKFFEASFFVVKDNQYAFFSSDRENGFGGLDLYLTMKQPDGSWSEALNLGANVNTEFDEDAPYVTEDGTLYFSSRGHNSIGGFDIFKSTAQGAAWSIAENLGTPVNTPFNDLYFTPEQSNMRGYFSSDRPGGSGDKDIYQAIFRNEVATDSIMAAVQPVLVESEPEIPKDIPVPAPEAPVSISKKVLVSGTILNETTRLPLSAQFAISQKKPNVLIVSAVSDSISGRYSVELEKGIGCSVLVQKEGYFYFAGDISVPEAYQPDTLTKNIALKKIETGAKIILNNIFFEYGKDVLSKSSQTELNRMATLLRENPTVKIEISGHTDDKGKAAYNTILSLKRARSVLNYLVKKGIAANRLTAIGLGSKRPVASNRFEEGRKLNRRTEFKVLSQ